MQDYKSLCAAAAICSTPQTDTHTDNTGPAYSINWVSWAKIPHKYLTINMKELWLSAFSKTLNYLSDCRMATWLGSWQYNCPQYHAESNSIALTGDVRGRHTTMSSFTVTQQCIAVSQTSSVAYKNLLQKHCVTKHIISAQRRQLLSAWQWINIIAIGIYSSK